MTALPIHIRLDPDASERLHTQVYHGLRRAIAEGLVRPGELLPSTRALATDLRVGRNTVLRAVQRLQTEGLVEGRVGSGVRVRRAAQDGGHATAASANEVRPASAARRPFNIEATPVDLFPEQMWARVASRRWRQSARGLISSANPAGYPPLRRAIADYVRSARGVPCDAAQVLVTSGTRHGLEFIARSLLRSGDRVLVEDPMRPDLRAVLLSFGLVPAPVAIDREGLRPAAARTAGRARAVLVSPACHFPAGVTLSIRRREWLVEWARANDALIIEDDRHGDTRFVGRPLPTLCSLEGGTRTLFVGSFSLTMYPSLRVGYVVVPSAMRDSMFSTLGHSEQHAPAGTQAMLADFLDEGHFARHLRRVRDALAERHDALLHGLSVHAGAVLDTWPANAGTHVVSWLPAEADEQAVCDAAHHAGVDVTGVTPMHHQPARSGLVLGFGAWTSRAIVGATKTLGTALARHYPHQLASRVSRGVAPLAVLPLL